MVSVQLLPSTVSRVDALAAERGWSRARMLRELIGETTADPVRHRKTPSKKQLSKSPAALETLEKILQTQQVVPASGLHTKKYPASSKCERCGLSARLDGTFDTTVPCKEGLI